MSSDPIVVHGVVAPGFEGVIEAFRRNFVEHDEVGASFTAIRAGELVVDIWGGLADLEEQRPWDRQTLSVLFSGTKGLVALCLLMLVDRGQLDLQAPVSTYWPEFASGGKQDVLVIDALSHRAGVPGISPRVTMRDAADGRYMAQLVAAEPKLTGGPEFVYHAMTFGWICGELIRRIDGRSVGRFFAEEVAQPLDLEIWIGLPEEHESRVATLEPGDWDHGVALDDPVARSIYGNPPLFVEGFLPANTRAWHASEIPAVSGTGDAPSLARLYAWLADDGRIDATRRLLSAEMVELARTCLARGKDPFMRNPIAFSAGFELERLGPPADAFGSNGAGGSCQGSWPSQRIGFAYLPNRLHTEVEAQTEFEASDPRVRALLASLFEAVEDDHDQHVMAD